MSEFTCRNGHQVNAGEFECPYCGKRIFRMDGMSRSEIRQQEIQDMEIENEDCR